MPAKRLSMRKLKDVLRLKIEHGLTDRAVAPGARLDDVLVFPV